MKCGGVLEGTCEMTSTTVISQSPMQTTFRTAVFWNQFLMFIGNSLLWLDLLSLIKQDMTQLVHPVPLLKMVGIAYSSVLVWLDLRHLYLMGIPRWFIFTYLNKNLRAVLMRMHCLVFHTCLYYAWIFLVVFVFSFTFFRFFFSLSIFRTPDSDNYFVYSPKRLVYVNC